MSIYSFLIILKILRKIIFLYLTSCVAKKIPIPYTVSSSNLGIPRNVLRPGDENVLGFSGVNLSVDVDIATTA